MKHYFIFGGKSSADYGVFIAAATQFDAPRRDTETITIPGRNGTLVMDNGRYENAVYQYQAYVQGDISRRLEAVRAWLLQTSGYKVLKDTLHPDEFYMARYVEEFKIEDSDRVGAAFALIFDRRPQRFKEDGNMPISGITRQTTIYNRYMYEAKPLIRAYGTGSFTIGDVTVKITAANGYTDIDCDLEEAYKDSIEDSRNSSIQLPAHKFPSLKSGNNAVELSGVTRLDIMPRWWTL